MSIFYFIQLSFFALYLVLAEETSAEVPEGTEGVLEESEEDPVFEYEGEEEIAAGEEEDSDMLGSDLFGDRKELEEGLDKLDEGKEHEELVDRMTLCLNLFRYRMTNGGEEIKEAVQQLMQEGKIKEEEATNMVGLQLISNCYFNVAVEEVAAQKEQKDEFFSDMQTIARLVGPTELQKSRETPSPVIFSPNQWKVLGEVNQKEMDRQTEEAKQARAERAEKAKANKKDKKEKKSSSPYKPLGSDMSTFNSIMFMITFFSIFFGGSYLLITKKLSKLNDKPNKLSKEERKMLKKQK